MSRAGTHQPSSTFGCARSSDSLCPTWYTTSPVSGTMYGCTDHGGSGHSESTSPAPSAPRLLRLAQLYEFPSSRHMLSRLSSQSLLV